MLKFTRLVLKRPVTTLLAVLSLLFFGAMAIFSSTLELTPDINMPMLIVTTAYPGAAPADVNELITKEIEEYCGTLNGIDSMTANSNENYSLVLLTYEYGTDMDNAYTQLRKKLDRVKAALPEDAEDPQIIEMNINSMPSMYIAVENSSVGNIYNYVKKYVSPEFEKIPAVASVDISGGEREYVSIRLIPELVQKYRLDISTIATLVGSASYSMPAGSTKMGNLDLSVSSGIEYETVEKLKQIPISAGNGSILYLEDIAEVSLKNKELASFGDFNGKPSVLMGLNLNQKYTAVELSREAQKAIGRLKENNPNLDCIIVDDSSEMILSSVDTMFKTMLIAVLISTVVLFLFYGDIKASLIVATSIPVSILTAFIMMWAKGYSLNVITLGSVVLGVGMMVDNSIVLLESCFRAMEANPDKTFKGYIRAAIDGADMVAASVFGSTLTTCVVFLPLGFLNGLSGQFFQPLGLTIVFCMTASLLSAVSLVPLCYVFYKPQEKEKAPAYRAVRSMQRGYRAIMEGVLSHKALYAVGTVLLLAVSVFLSTRLETVLIPEIDQGMVQISVNVQEGLNARTQYEVFREVEGIIATDEDVDKYILMAGSSSVLSSGDGSIVAMLKENRVKDTKTTVREWRKRLQAVDNCDISVEAYSETSIMNMETGFSVTLLNSDYDKLKKANDSIVEALMQDGRVTDVSSGMDNGAPLVKVKIDPVSAAAEGFVPAQLSGMLYVMLNGKEADTMEVEGQELSVMVEYPEDQFDGAEKIRNIELTSTSGSTVLLGDIAQVCIEDSPVYISRIDKQYQTQISAMYTGLADKNTAADLRRSIVLPLLTDGTSEKENAMQAMLGDEFENLFKAIAIAVFLVFVVMAAQFESARFSFMVMTTVPFSLIGSFTLLWLFDIPLSMPALIGFLMLIGTVVNNGILYVDTVDQFRAFLPFERAVIEAGAVRLRPILMTTLTTVLSMIPMALGVGSSGALMQGLAMVNVGGLTTSTLLALFVLPVFYCYMSKNKAPKPDVSIYDLPARGYAEAVPEMEDDVCREVTGNMEDTEDAGYAENAGYAGYAGYAENAEYAKDAKDTKYAENAKNDEYIKDTKDTKDFNEGWSWRE